jgi:hypothetical protein
MVSRVLFFAKVPVSLHRQVRSLTNPPPRVQIGRSNFFAGANAVAISPGAETRLPLRTWIIVT